MALLPKIIIDSREMNSGVPKLLDRIADIRIEEMSVGDYCVSDRCCIERKDINDFFNSLFKDRKLFSQLIDLTNAYERPILLFEGGDPFMSGRMVNPKAVQGILNTITLMRIPILYSINKQNTAEIIYMLAAKEQNEDKRPVQHHGKRSHLTSSEQLTYVLSAVPDIGATTANNLLTHFKTLRAVANAEAVQLQEVPLVGKQTASHLKAFFERVYE